MSVHYRDNLKVIKSAFWLNPRNTEAAKRVEKIESLLHARSVIRVEEAITADREIAAVLIDGYYPICVAIDLYEDETDDELKIIQCLLDANATRVMFSDRSDRYHTPLHWAILRNRMKILRLLIEYHPPWVDLYLKVKANPFFAAAEEGKKDIFQHLIEFAKPNLGHLVGLLDGTTILHVVSRSCHWNMIEFLLWLGADPFLIDENGFTPFYLYISSMNWFGIGEKYIDEMDKWKAILGTETDYAMQIVNNVVSGYARIPVEVVERFRRPLSEEFVLGVRSETYFEKSLTARLLIEV